MSKKLTELPHPKGSLILGHRSAFARNQLEFLTKCANEYGDIVPLLFGQTPACLLNHPDYIEQVLRKRELFVKRGDLLRNILGDGLVTAKGESWFRQRRLVQPVFHQKRIANYAKVMVDYTESLLETWQDGEIRDIHGDMSSLTLDIVVKTIFNIDFNNIEAKTIGYALSESLDWIERRRKEIPVIGKLFSFSGNLRFQKAMQDMDETIYKVIHQRRQDRDNGDLLSMLIQAEDEADGSSMNDKQLRDEVATLMIAGHETTANTLAWTWMLLSQHPQVQDKLLTELEEVLNGRSPSIEDIPHLRYTEMVIKEAMRLYPPVPFIPRKAAVDTEIDGYSIPAGCVLIMSQWVMHRHPRYFSEPLTFIPERWRDNFEKTLPRGVYFPFGDGPRICVGKSFALMEAVLLLATIAQKFQIKLVPDFEITPQVAVALRPRNGIKVLVTKR